MQDSGALCYTKLYNNKKKPSRLNIRAQRGVINLNSACGPARTSTSCQIISVLASHPTASVAVISTILFSQIRPNPFLEGNAISIIIYWCLFSDLYAKIAQANVNNQLKLVALQSTYRYRLWVNYPDNIASSRSLFFSFYGSPLRIKKFLVSY